jgi:hypothetical protein
MSRTAVFDDFAVGDIRPIVVEIEPSDDAQVASASYQIVRRSDPAGVVWDPGAACVVKKVTCGFVIATPDLITFPTADVYTARFQITWDDGVVDNTVSASITVRPPSR